MTSIGDQELREELHRAAARPLVPPLPLEDIVAAGLRRRRINWATRAGASILAAAAIAVLAVITVPGFREAGQTPVGASSHSLAPSPTPGQTAGPGPRPPACHADDVRAAAGPPVSPATGEVAATYTIQSTSTTPCTLFGIPSVTLRAADGAALPFRYTHKPTQYVPRQQPKPVILVPGQAAASLLVAKYRCDGGDLAHAATIEIIISGERLTAPIGNPEIAYCHGGPHDPGQVVAVSAFQHTQ